MKAGFGPIGLATVWSVQREAHVAGAWGRGGQFGRRAVPWAPLATGGARPMWRISHIPAENDTCSDCVQHQNIASGTKHWKWCALGMGLVRERGVAVNSIAAWVDAKPYRLKLVLLAHTVILVGVVGDAVP